MKSKDNVHNQKLSVKSHKIISISENLIYFLIILNLISIILESFQPLYVTYSYYFRLFEIFSVGIFSMEYVIRLWSCYRLYPTIPRYRARIKYFFTLMALVDLFAILPFYLPFLLFFDLRVLRMFRITRLTRIFKLNRYSKALQIIGKVLTRKKDELLATVSLMMFLILISSTLMYYAESSVQPDKFPNIIASFWWAVATLTTVGYGDVYPLTILGKVLSSLIAISGIGLVALPTGIIGSGFVELIREGEKKKCPHCGQALDYK